VKQRGPVSTKISEDMDIDRLENLVDELIKQSPQEARIKAYMQKVGLDYTSDPIERFNSVLMALESRISTQVTSEKATHKAIDKVTDKVIEKATDKMTGKMTSHRTSGKALDTSGKGV
jgi:hypothetical protein